MVSRGLSRKFFCNILEVGNSRQVLYRLDDEKQTVILNDTLSRNPKTQVVNKAGLYTLIIGSRKPEAKTFKRWITHDVIPSIRKHGAYMTENTIEQAISDPDFMIGLLTSLKKEKAKRIEMEKENEALIRYNEILMVNLDEKMPKAEKYEAFLDTEELTTLTIVGKHFLGGISAGSTAEILTSRRCTI
ncbi:BRO-N domain-containing protein [Bacillus mycoides]|uniref:BRO-N domain-containing protein n=1 Tax=Bacillus mycoides TaxID=1405 RepID=UPI003D0580DA